MTVSSDDVKCCCSLLPYSDVDWNILLPECTGCK